MDHDTDTSVSFINSVKALFPPQLVTLRGVQWAQPHVRHRFLLGESHDALYVSFMGTKLPRDMATNANLFQASRRQTGAAPAPAPGSLRACVWGSGQLGACAGRRALAAGRASMRLGREGDWAERVVRRANPFPQQGSAGAALLWAPPRARRKQQLPAVLHRRVLCVQEEVVLDAAMLSSGAAPAADDEDGGGVNGGGAAGGGGRALAAHRGFLARARSVPIHSLYREARARGKRLVLCGECRAVSAVL